MLTLRTNSYDFDNVLDREYCRLDTRIENNVRVRGINVYSVDISSALMPLAFNEIGIYKRTYGIDYNVEEIDDPAYYVNARDNIITALEQDYNNCLLQQFGIIRVYTNDVNRFIQDLTEANIDYLSTPPTAIQDLYNKCMSQVAAREEIMRELQTKIKLFKGKHMVLLVSNYSDTIQASDTFLTIGLIPVLFKDWSSKFNEEEIEYFKVLVQRSQVKRIANVKAEAAFKTAIATKKYTDIFQEIKFGQTIQRVVNARISNARDNVANAEHAAERALRDYEAARSLFYEANKILNNIQQAEEDTKAELKTALSMDGIVNIDMQNYSTITIYFRTPVVFYDQDEVECYLHNIGNNIFKQFLTDIFIEQKYKLYFLNIFTFSFEPNQSFNSPGSFSRSYLRNYKALFNPHTWFYQCLGDYKPRLADAYAKKDLLLFNNIALASTKSINFKDGAVMNRWKEWFYRMVDNYNSDYDQMEWANIKCIEDEDGNMFSIKELYLDNTQEEPIELEVQDA